MYSRLLKKPTHPTRGCVVESKKSFELRKKYQRLFRQRIILTAEIAEKSNIRYASASQSKTDTKIYLNEDSPLGEDGHIIKKKGNYLHAVVFDGVGGSNNSRQIVEFLKDYVHKNETIYGKLDDIVITPPNIPPTGATTIACANISPTTLDCMAVGDSVVQVYRNDKQVFTSTSLQHTWNMPAQMAFVNNMLNYTLPPVFQSFPLQTNDVIILSTDGMIDNLFVEEIEQIVSRWKEPRTISQLLVASTKRKINQRNVSTPFGKSIEKLLSDPIALQEFKNDLPKKNDNIEQELKNMMTRSKNDDCTVITIRID
jgi:serine/threonine protein phosphatase PrpC